jgi:2-amino-4-hydroxy-6-hydroxymethyldihydropteridine diphosphokinase
MVDTEKETVILSLGSNLGNPRYNILNALSIIESRGFSIIRISSFYKTSPVGKCDQPDFINAAVTGTTQLSPVELLSLCKEIELQLGRNPDAPRWSVRVIDIDIIFYGRRWVQLPNLTIPHALFAERLFVLAPAVEIAPDFIMPDGLSLSAFFEARRADNIFSGQNIEII